LVLAALVAGCSASNSPAVARGSSAMERKVADGFARPAGTTPHARGWLSPGAKTARCLLYWGNFSTSTVTIYKEAALPKEVVTNFGNDTITEYALGKTSPRFTISEDIANPTDRRRFKGHRLLRQRRQRYRYRS
jgi:hypothetical protein